MDNEIKIIQINARSITKNKNVIELLLDREQIDFVLVSETWLNHNNFKINGYVNYYRNRQDGYGGVAILISKLYFSNEVKLPFNLELVEAITIRIKLNKKEYHLSAIYIPPNTNTKKTQSEFQMLIDYTQQLKKFNFWRRCECTTSYLG